MPLELDDRRLLPEGIHDATLDEVARVFGRYSRGDRRVRLMDNLRRYVADVRATGWGCQILIDGSFVMPGVDEPNDIDIILVMPPDWDFGRTDLRPFEYNVLSKKASRRDFKIEAFAVAPDSEDYERMFTLFSRIRYEWCERFGWPPDSRKGMVRIIE